jgi:hypothetical protein
MNTLPDVADATGNGNAPRWCDALAVTSAGDDEVARTRPDHRIDANTIDAITREARQ